MTEWTQELQDYWLAHCQDNGWKNVPLSVPQDSMTAMLCEIDRLNAYAIRLLSEESRTWHCECGHNWTGMAIAEGKAYCPECEQPMRPMSEVRQEEIDRLTAELEKYRWIPVSERLPSSFDRVLSWKKKEIFDGFVFGAEYWMTRPEPPKEEK